MQLVSLFLARPKNFRQHLERLLVDIGVLDVLFRLFQEKMDDIKLCGNISKGLWQTTDIVCRIVDVFGGIDDLEVRIPELVLPNEVGLGICDNV